MKRLREAEADGPDHNPESSRGRDVNTEDSRSNERMSSDPILHSKHKIFLSHSGAQKDFVEQLCQDLENRYHFPFFDKRPSSLPKGERFPDLILKAARQCQMAIIVISEEYFVSKWPMIELHAFVQARLGLNPKLKILPLFYKLSVHEFCNEKRKEQWFNIWEDWAKVDSRINVDEWKDSLKVLASFNGIEYNEDSRGIVAYRENIVSNICNEVPSEIKWDDSHVQGRSNLCQELRCKFNQIQASNKNKACLIGIYGVGGIGKTTICKTLCNELCQEFNGRVSHIEFGFGNYEELLNKVLKELINIDENILLRLEKGKGQYILRKLMYKQKIFLAVDNVWDDSKSIEEGKMYLETNYHEDSIVMVTSRSLKTLTYLGIKKSHCFEMPELKYEDAENLFIQHAAYGFQFSNYDDICAINKCVALCYFNKGDIRGGHYLPLALKALGTQLGCLGRKPVEWVKALPKVKDFNYLQEEQNPVFSILRSSFDRLRPMDQSLFIDLILYNPKNQCLMEWLSLVYNQDLQEIESRVQRLKERGLVEFVDMTAQRVYTHDLYSEFAKLEAQGKLNQSADFEKRRWVYYEDAYPTELEMTPSHSCWQNLTRIAIVESTWTNDGPNLLGIEWRYFSNVVVLKLEGLHKLQGELNLKGLKCLRSLDITGICEHLDTINGLQDLNNLTYFCLKTTGGPVHTAILGQFPTSLKVLEVSSTSLGVLLRPDVFARCTKLSRVVLGCCRVEILDFRNCTSLQSVRFKGLALLRNVCGLTPLHLID